MISNSNLDKVVCALKLAIKDTFTYDMWIDLGDRTGTKEIITDHSRLLRSLQFGDDDYEFCIRMVLPKIIEMNPENLSIIEEFVGLEKWLKENDNQLYSDLYGGVSASLADVEKSAQINNLTQLNKQLLRIRNSISEDPELAIGSSKELLESLMKKILVEHGYNIGKEDLPKLLKEMHRVFGFEEGDSNKSEHNKFIRVINNLGQVIVGIGELRNHFGTGHGRDIEIQINDIHARLVVDAATTVANYYLALYLSRVRSK